MTAHRELFDLEAKARETYEANTSDSASAVLRGRNVMVRVISSMINRGAATGMTYKALYYLDGKRIAFAKLVAVLERTK